MLHTQRRLLAVLAADAVGYSRLAEAAEEETHARLMQLRAEVIDPCVAAHGGTIIKNTGDGFLATFGSPQAGTDCALALQRALTAAEAARPADRRIDFRMAVHQASVIVDQDDIFGDGVNVAARLQTYAQPGGVIVSGSVAEQISAAHGAAALDLGEIPLRNLQRPIRAFALQGAALPAPLLGDALPGREQRPSIAVLPFRKYQTDPEEAYFAEGIVEDIIHALGGLKELFVIARGSTLSYGGDRLDVRAVGRELGVRYVLYGSVRRRGGRLRIATELSDAETGAVISVEQHDGDLEELWELQDRISLDVVKTIAPHVREHELRRALRKRPESMTAYDFLLQALALLYRMDADSFGRARGLLQQAMAHDPDYAPPYTYTAFWHIFRVGEMGSPDPEADAAAGAYYASAALERDPEDAQALAFNGQVQSFLLRDFDKARLFLDRALAAGPNLAMAWTMSSANAGYVGDGATAVRHAEQGVRLSPRDAYTFWHEGMLAQAHFINGDLERALGWARSAVAHNPRIRFTLRTLIASLGALGRSEEAALAAHHLLRLQPGFRLGPYAQRCPFRQPMLDRWIGLLRSAGLPE